MKIRTPVLAVLLFSLLLWGCKPAEDYAGDNLPGEEDPASGSVELLSFLRGGDLWELSITNHEEKRLTEYGDIVYFEWSPDGKHVALLRNLKRSVLHGDVAELWIKNSENKQMSKAEDDVLINVIFGKEPETTFVTGWLGQWHPDGTHLAYVPALNGAHVLRIRSINDSVTDIPAGGNILEKPRWHPRGDILAFAAGDTFSGESVVMICNMDGTVTGEINGAHSPEWNLSGNRFVYVKNDICELSGFYEFSGVMLEETGEDTGRIIFDEDDRLYWPEIHFCPRGGCISLAGYEHLWLITIEGGDAKWLLKQDIMTTYSEFSLPLPYLWSPCGEYIAALRYTETGEIERGVEGYWDLVVTDVDIGPEKVIIEKMFTVSGGLDDVPPYLYYSFTWPQSPGYILTLTRSGKGAYDIWKVEILTGERSLLLENACTPVSMLR